MVVEGQVHGGLAQGIAEALFEGAVYDEEGNLLTGSLAGAATAAAADGTEPPDDTSASADLRRHLARFLTQRAVSEAVAR